jgi:ketosteroid isomerase-like protein
MWADAATAEAVRSVLEHLADAIAARDLDRTMALFDDAPDTTLVGSEAGELALGPAAIRDHFARIYAGPAELRFAWGPMRIAASGGVAWLSTDAAVTVRPAGAVLPYRLAAVLAHGEEGWRLRLFAGSEPARA